MGFLKIKSGHFYTVNLVTTNSSGPGKFVCDNYDFIITEVFYTVT
jgi:hypothetical protein